MGEGARSEPGIFGGVNAGALARTDQIHWWYRSKAALVSAALDRTDPVSGLLVDLGGGSGGVTAQVRWNRGSRLVVEGAHELVTETGRRYGMPGLRADVAAVPLASGSASAVSLARCHRAPRGSCQRAPGGEKSCRHRRSCCRHSSSARVAVEYRRRSARSRASLHVPDPARPTTCCRSRTRVFEQRLLLARRAGLDPATPAQVPGCDRPRCQLATARCGCTPVNCARDLPSH